MALLYPLLLAFALLGTAESLLRSSARSHGIASSGDCKASLCGGMATYPVAPGMQFYSTFNVPGLPKNQSAIENDITFFIYQVSYVVSVKLLCARARVLLRTTCRALSTASARHRTFFLTVAQGNARIVG